MIRTILLSALCAVLLLSSCRAYQQVELVGIRDAQVSRFDAQGVAARVFVDIHNPNPYRIKVKKPDVDLYLNDVYFGKAVLDSTLELQRNSTLTYAVPLHATMQGGGASMLPLMLGTLLGGQVKLAAKGTVVAKVGLFSKRFPFEAEHMLDLGR